jgi:hypothetical protein
VLISEPLCRLFRLSAGLALSGSCSLRISVEISWVGTGGVNNMPFKKPDGKASTEDSQSSTKARKIFIGRDQELDFFVEKILKPDVPAHNIISISGEGGIGKTELLHQFRDKARSLEFKEYW